MIRLIARKSGLDSEALWRDHLLRQEPVVLTDAAAGAPVSAWRTLDACRAQWGALPITIRGEYTSSLLTALETGRPPAGPLTLSFDAYWARVARDPGDNAMCIEEQAPPILREAFPVPAVCRLQNGQPDPAMKSNVFVGNAGNVASLHFDGDCRHVLLYQVFGRKRVVIIGPAHWRAAAPLCNFARLRLQAMAPEAQRRALDALDAWETILEPGEAIVMPALVNHYVEYLDHGMSLNYRFGRHGFHRFVSEALHFDAQVQRLASATLDVAACRQHREALDALIAVFDEPALSAWQKYLQMSALIRLMCDELGAPDSRRTLPDAVYVTLPEVVRQYLLRAHLFNERLYRHREPLQSSTSTSMLSALSS